MVVSAQWQKGNEKVDDTPERKPVIRIESKDPSGEYKVRAKVSDRNAAITVELETQLRLK